jgi:hypothetical protein
VASGRSIGQFSTIARTLDGLYRRAVQCVNLTTRRVRRRQVRSRDLRDELLTALKPQVKRYVFAWCWRNLKE